MHRWTRFLFSSRVMLCSGSNVQSKFTEFRRKRKSTSPGSAKCIPRAKIRMPKCTLVMFSRFISFVLSLPSNFHFCFSLTFFHLYKTLALIAPPSISIFPEVSWPSYLHLSTLLVSTPPCTLPVETPTQAGLQHLHRESLQRVHQQYLCRPLSMPLKRMCPPHH